MCACCTNPISADQCTGKVLCHSADSHGGLIIYVRTKPSYDAEFAQVLLPVALSYETFLCKLCVALGVERQLVKKVVKLPDILIRSTEDVIRITPFEKLEIVLHTSLWKHNARTKWRGMKPWCSMWFWTMLMVFAAMAAVSSNNLMKKYDEFTRLVESLDRKLQSIESELASNSKSAMRSSGNAEQMDVDKVVKRIVDDLRTVESNVIDEQLHKLDDAIDKLTAYQAQFVAFLTDIVEQHTQLQQQSAAKSTAKRSKTKGEC